MYPNQGGYPPQSGASSGGYPPQQGGYPPQSGPHSGGYPPQQGGYPPQQGGYPPHSGGYPPQQGGYPPQQGGYPPQQGGYPPQKQQGGYPPQHGAYPPQQSGYPPQQGGYPPQQQHGGYPSQHQGGFAPPQGGGVPGGMSLAPPSGFQQHWYASFYTGMPQQQQQGLAQWFASVDRDRSGQISVYELAQMRMPGAPGAMWANRPLGEAGARKLMKLFDNDRSGQISFYEFGALHGFVDKMQAAFFAADRDRSGTLDAREIHGALQQAGFPLDMVAVDAYFRKYNTGRGLDFVSFMLLVSDVAQAKSRFEMADKDRSGTLNLQEFLSIVGDLTLAQGPGYDYYKQQQATRGAYGAKAQVKAQKKEHKAEKKAFKKDKKHYGKKYGGDEECLIM